MGSHFLNAAHQAGHEIRALRRSTCSSPRVALLREPVWVESPLTEVPIDDLHGCDVLVHLAAHSANVPYDSLENCLRMNVLEPMALLAQAVEAGIRHFVIAGSCFEFGLAGERFEFIPPTAPLEPTLSYPTAKAAASIAFAGLARERNLRLSVLRIFQVFGEGEQASRMWPSLRAAALAGRDMPMTPGEQVRDFINVRDVANVFVDALSWPLEAGNPLFENIGSGRPVTVRAFAERWWSQWNASGRLLFGALPYRQNEVMRFVPQISKLSSRTISSDSLEK